MQNKFYLVIFILFNFSFMNTYAQTKYMAETSDVNGVWFEVYDLVAGEIDDAFISEHTFSWGTAKMIANAGLFADITKDKPVICNIDSGIFSINSVKKTKDDTVIIRGNRDVWEVECTFRFIDEDTMEFLMRTLSVKGGDLKKTPTLYRRFSGPARIPVQKAVVNNTKVRLRTRPKLLNNNTWTYLNTGEAIEIIDKSPEKMKIDDTEEYWYKVRSDKHPDGWVYGAYVDILDPKSASD